MKKPDDYMPTWYPQTAGLHRIPFTKQNGFLVPTSLRNEPTDWFYFVADDILLENIGLFFIVINQKKCVMLE